MAGNENLDVKKLDRNFAALLTKVNMPQSWKKRTKYT